MLINLEIYIYFTYLRILLLFSRHKIHVLPLFIYNKTYFSFKILLRTLSKKLNSRYGSFVESSFSVKLKRLFLSLYVWILLCTCIYRVYSKYIIFHRVLDTAVYLQRPSFVITRYSNEFIGSLEVKTSKQQLFVVTLYGVQTFSGVTLHLNLHIFF